MCSCFCEIWAFAHMSLFRQLTDRFMRLYLYLEYYDYDPSDVPADQVEPDYEQYDSDGILISDKTKTKVNILDFKLY